MSLFIIYLHTRTPQAGYIRVKETQGLGAATHTRVRLSARGLVGSKEPEPASLAVPLPDLNNNNLLVTLVGTARFRFGSALY